MSSENLKPSVFQSLFNEMETSPTYWKERHALLVEERSFMIREMQAMKNELYELQNRREPAHGQQAAWCDERVARGEWIMTTRGPLAIVCVELPKDLIGKTVLVTVKE